MKSLAHLVGRLCASMLSLGLALAAGAALGQAPTADQSARDYVLGPGDTIAVKVFQNADLSVEARVSETGTIAYPLLREVPVAGLTTSETSALIGKRLVDGNFVRSPYVTVGIVAYRSLQVSVLGQVLRPGRYPMEQSTTRVTEVLALAGGAIPTASDVVWLITKEGGREKRIEVDIPLVLQTGDASKNPLVRNGDTIFVPRAPVFYIYGEAQRPGQYRVERGMNVTQALAVGGGPTPRGTDRGVRLSRRDASGNLVTREATPNEPILPDDVLQVRERLF
jgi:polysaccharide biosynthesis/export protein